MFNTTNVVQQVTSRVEIQACPGGIYKSHPKSMIKRMQFQSPLAKTFFDYDQPYIILTKDGKDEKKLIVILQVVNSINNYVLVEYMYKEDYEAENVYFTPDGTPQNDCSKNTPT